jgi:hypothetical protein
MKPDTVKDRGFWWNFTYLLAGVINIPKNNSNHDQHNGVRPDVIKSRLNKTRGYFVVHFDRYAIDFPYGDAAIVRGDFKFLYFVSIISVFFILLATLSLLNIYFKWNIQ